MKIWFMFFLRHWNFLYICSCRFPVLYPKSLLIQSVHDDYQHCWMSVKVYISQYFLPFFSLIIFYFVFSYGSSVIHLFDVFSSGTSIARFENQLFDAAPCQFFTFYWNIHNINNMDFFYFLSLSLIIHLCLNSSSFPSEIVSP